MKTIDIKGKDYVPVTERLLYFRKHFPDWKIVTEIIKLDQAFVLMKAAVLDADGVTRATAHAYEKENSSFINKTSYIENCETSAVGRALGILGIGIDTSLASYEEVATAVKNQNRNYEPKSRPQRKKQTVSLDEILNLKDFISEAGKKEEDILKWAKVDKLEHMTKEQIDFVRDTCRQVIERNRRNAE